MRNTGTYHIRHQDCAVVYGVHALSGGIDWHLVFGIWPWPLTAGDNLSQFVNFHR